MTGEPTSALITPSEPAREQALTALPASLGSLRDLAAWVSACQGQFPPRPLNQCTILAVSASTSPVLIDGTEPESVAAAEAGAQLRHVTVGSSSESAAAQPMTGLQFNQAMELGKAAVQTAVSEGTDCFVVARYGADFSESSSASDSATASDIAALSIIGVLTHTEPVLLVDRPADVDVAEWKRITVATRNEMFRGRRLRHDPLGLLRTIGTPEIAALTAALLETATTRTPLLLDGPVTLAAAMLAHELDPNSKAWWRAGSSSAHLVQAIAMEQLALQPVLSLDATGSSGLGATVALQLVKTAVALCGAAEEPQAAPAQTAEYPIAD